MSKDIAQSPLRDAVDARGDTFTSAQFRGHHRFSLIFRFDGKQARARDVSIDESKVRAPCDHGVVHAPALCFVGNQMHVCARYEFHAAAT